MKDMRFVDIPVDKDLPQEVKAIMERFYDNYGYTTIAVHLRVATCDNGKSWHSAVYKVVMGSDLGAVTIATVECYCGFGKPEVSYFWTDRYELKALAEETEEYAKRMKAEKREAHELKLFTEVA